MAESKQLPKREEGPIEKTWDLTTIFKTDEDWETAYDEAAKEVDKLNEFQGTLADGADQLLKVLETIHDDMRKVEKHYVNSHITYKQNNIHNTYKHINTN